MRRSRAWGRMNETNVQGWDLLAVPSVPASDFLCECVPAVTCTLNNTSELHSSLQLMAVERIIENAFGKVHKSAGDLLYI